MRLIDADELLKEYEKARRKDAVNPKRLIEEAPTVACCKDCDVDCAFKEFLNKSVEEMPF